MKRLIRVEEKKWKFCSETTIWTTSESRRVNEKLSNISSSILLDRSVIEEPKKSREKIKLTKICRKIFFFHATHTKKIVWKLNFYFFSFSWISPVVCVGLLTVCGMFPFTFVCVRRLNKKKSPTLIKISLNLNFHHSSTLRIIISINWLLSFNFYFRYQNELPKKIKQRGRDAHLIHEELVQCMKWKQSVSIRSV